MRHNTTEIQCFLLLHAVLMLSSGAGSLVHRATASAPRSWRSLLCQQAALRRSRARQTSPCKAVDVMATDSAASAAQVSIRLATPEDASQLHNIIHRAYRTEASWTTEVDLVSGERIGFHELEAMLDDNAPLQQRKDPVFVATLCGPSESSGTDSAGAAARETLVGCIQAEWARHHPDRGLPPCCAMFGLFAVDPDHQSKRIGSQLFDHALAHAADVWTCKEAVLWVIKHRQDILKWYERKGFRWSGKEKPFVFPELALKDDIDFLVLIKRL